MVHGETVLSEEGGETSRRLMLLVADLRVLIHPAGELGQLRVD
jgi:hypothetical protein